MVKPIQLILNKTNLEQVLLMGEGNKKYRPKIRMVTMFVRKIFKAAQIEIKN